MLFAFVVNHVHIKDYLDLLAASWPEGLIPSRMKTYVEGDSCQEKKSR